MSFNRFSTDRLSPLTLLPYHLSFTAVFIFVQVKYWSERNHPDKTFCFCVIPAWASSTLQSSPCVFERTQAAAVYHSNSYLHPSEEMLRRTGALSRSPARRQEKCDSRNSITTKQITFLRSAYLVCTWVSGWFGSSTFYCRKNFLQYRPV